MQSACNSFRRTVTWTFAVLAVGALFGTLLSSRLRTTNAVSFGKTSIVRDEAAITATGVSHNPEIEKKVLAGYMDLPHVTQVARAELRPGQVASENMYVFAQFLLLPFNYPISLVKMVATPCSIGRNNLME